MYRVAQFFAELDSSCFVLVLEEFFIYLNFVILCYSLKLLTPILDIFILSVYISVQKVYEVIETDKPVFFLHK